VIGEGANLGSPSAVASKGQKGIKLKPDAIDQFGFGVTPRVRSISDRAAAPNAMVASAERPQQPACRDDRRSRHVGGTQQYLQTLALSLPERKAWPRPASSTRLMQWLEQRGLLTAPWSSCRTMWRSPSAPGAASLYTRPELAVLLAYAIADALR